MQQFNQLGSAYAHFVRTDPMRQSLHYPAIIQALQKSKKDVRRILDIGCGDGTLDRVLASPQYGYQVTGFDSAPDLIREAQEKEDVSALGIRYSVAAADAFVPSETYGNAISVLVLPYARDAEYLRHFFHAAYESIDDGGHFYSITFNPAFRAFDTIIGNRRFVKEGGLIQVQFLDPQTTEPCFRSRLRQFSREDYESAATKAGLAGTQWEKLQPTSESLEALGETFWGQCIREQPYTLFTAAKGVGAS